MEDSSGSVPKLLGARAEAVEFGPFASGFSRVASMRFRIRVGVEEGYTPAALSPSDSTSSPAARPGSLSHPDGLSAPQLAMYVGIGSMTMLFGASLVGYFVTRAQAKAWRAVDLPELPWGLWLSTALLLSLSWALFDGERAIKKNQTARSTQRLFIALLLGGLFGASQVENWRQVARSALSVEVKGLYVYSFFMLTALHAVHVLAGLIPLWLTHRRSIDMRYSSSNREGIRLLRQYWDFLLVVWVVLLGALHLG